MSSFVPQTAVSPGRQSVSITRKATKHVVEAPVLAAGVGWPSEHCKQPMRAARRTWVSPPSSRCRLRWSCVSILIFPVVRRSSVLPFFVQAHMDGRCVYSTRSEVPDAMVRPVRKDPWCTICYFHICTYLGHIPPLQRTDVHSQGRLPTFR